MNWLEEIEKKLEGWVMTTWREVWTKYTEAFDMFLDAMDLTVRKIEEELKVIYRALKRFAGRVYEALKEPVETPEPAGD